VSMKVNQRIEKPAGIDIHLYYARSNGTATRILTVASIDLDS
jgi:hypothetical protein